MATYRNRNDDTIFYGGEFKLNISMDVIDGNSLTLSASKYEAYLFFKRFS